MGHQAFDDCVVLVNRPAGDQKKQRATQAVNIRPCIRRARIHGLFGSHVINRTHQNAGSGQPGYRSMVLAGLFKTSEPHIQNLDGSRFILQQIRRLDIPMNDPAAMCIGEPLCGLSNALDRSGNGQWTTALHDHGKIPTRDILHHQIVSPGHFTGVMRGHDIRMTELSGCFDFTLKTATTGLVLQHGRRNHLDRDFAFHRPVSGLEDLPHPALTQLLQQQIAADRQLTGFPPQRQLRLKQCQSAFFHQPPRQRFARGTGVQQSGPRPRSLNLIRTDQAVANQVFRKLIGR